MDCRDCKNYDMCDKQNDLCLWSDDLCELWYEEGVEKTCKNFKKKRNKIKIKFWLLLFLRLTFICLIATATATKGITEMTWQFWAIVLSAIGMHVIGLCE